jgi:hypothetical protein
MNWLKCVNHENIFEMFSFSKNTHLPTWMQKDYTIEKKKKKKALVQLWVTIE